MPNTTLPFPRGETYFDGDSSRATTTGVTHLLGQKFVIDGQHEGGTTGSAEPVVLMAVQNISNASLTVARRGVKFDTASAKGINRNVTGWVDAQGLSGYPIDDKYTAASTIINNDIFYVVVEGPCQIASATDTTSANISAHALVTFDATGRIEAAAANDHIVGRITQASTTATTGTSYLVHVGGGLVTNH